MKFYKKIILRYAKMIYYKNQNYLQNKSSFENDKS